MYFNYTEGDILYSAMARDISNKGMGVRPTHFTHLNIHANFVNFGTNHNQA